MSFLITLAIRCSRKRHFDELCTLTNLSALPSSILQQPPAEYHPQSNRSQASPNPALTTSLQSLSLDKATHSIESALTDDEGASSTIRRSWNAVPLTPQPGHARQHFRLNSPSPYDSASLILNNSLASSNVARNRNNVYSMSDDEGSGNSRVWYPLSGVRNEEVRYVRMFDGLSNSFLMLYEQLNCIN